MKDPNFTKQHDCDTGTFALFNVGAKCLEKRLNVSPWDRARDRAAKNRGECSFVFTLHFSTIFRY